MPKSVFVCVYGEVYKLTQSKYRQLLEKAANLPDTEEVYIEDFGKLVGSAEDLTYKSQEWFKEQLAK